MNIELENKYQKESHSQVDYEGPYATGIRSAQCKMIRYSNSIKETYNCLEVRLLSKTWKDDFRKENKTNWIIKHCGRDKYYEKFCGEIDTFLAKCKCIPSHLR